MRDEQPSRRIDQPEPGLFKMQLVARGPYVAARIERRLGILVATINGVPADVDYVWTSGDFVSDEQYEILLADPPSDPYRPLAFSMRGMADRMREQEDQDFWQRRPIV